MKLNYFLFKTFVIAWEVLLPVYYKQIALVKEKLNIIKKTSKILCCILNEENIGFSSLIRFLLIKSFI